MWCGGVATEVLGCAGSAPPTPNLCDTLRSRSIGPQVARTSVRRCREDESVQVQLLGVRGSRPAPGSDFVRYGGNTSCIAVAHADAPPTLLLDAGTGISTLTPHLGGRAFDGSILLTHLHWDHVYGLPFFPPGDRPDARCDLWMPSQGDAEQVLEAFMQPPHFPIRPRDLRGRWSFHGLEQGETAIEGFSVDAVEIPHKGGRTFGYRVGVDGRSIAYMPDHGPVELGDGPDGQGVIHDAALRLAAGVDVLFHDAQHTVEEFPRVRGFGHSTIDYAIALGQAAQVGLLVLFHHDPGRTDDMLDAIAERTAHLDLRVEVAREGATYGLADHP